MILAMPNTNPPVTDSGNFEWVKEVTAYMVWQ
jgi:dihydroorotase-like cyclic amidohydrolase